MKQNLLMLAVLLATLVAIPSKAHAGCWGFIDHTTSCAGGCVVDTTSCFFGCAPGTCVNQGGSGLCCKTIYYSDVIYGDGGSNECHYCSAARRAPKMSMNRGPHIPVNFWGGTTGLIQMGELASVRLERHLFVVNRCSHTYDDTSIALR